MRSSLRWRDFRFCFITTRKCEIPCCGINKLFYNTVANSPNDIQKGERSARPLRNLKPKAQTHAVQYFVDIRQVKTCGGKGGDGAISFLSLWANAMAGPDGGDGGHGGHVIFKATTKVRDLFHVSSLYQAKDGEKGSNKNAFGKNAEHTIVDVPIGTLVRSTEGKILADLGQQEMMFIAARGGAGGHGNAFFVSDVHQSPEISEYGAIGEEKQYVLEIGSMAHIGLIGFPNAGKSTLLRAISRARPKVAPYPFTTLKPHVGMVLYDDYEQVAVADLPGLIPESSKNKGLGISFLKHAERCSALLFILDISLDEPWVYFEILQNELNQFNEKLNQRSIIVVANKMDLPGAKENLETLRKKINFPVIPISAKTGENLTVLLQEMRNLYDKMKKEEESNESE